MKPGRKQVTLSTLVAAATIVALLQISEFGKADAAEYGRIVDDDDTDMTAWFRFFASDPDLAYEDDGDDALEATEDVWLNLNTDVNDDVDSTDVLVASTTASDNGKMPGASGASNLKFNTGATPLNDLLIYKDTLPALPDGGPDDKFNNGEGLYIDVNANGEVDSNDVRLGATAGKVAGARVQSTDTDAIEASWDPSPNTDASADECVYISSDGSVGAGDTRVSSCSGSYAEGSTPSCAGDDDCGRTARALPSGQALKITGSDTTWASATEEAYIVCTTSSASCASSTVNTGMFRVAVADSGETRGAVVQCSNDNPDSDCGTSLHGTALSNVKVTGGAHAIAFPDNSEGKAVGVVDADGKGSGIGNNDFVYFNFHGDVSTEGGADFPTPGDLRATLFNAVAFGTGPGLGSGEIDTVFQLRDPGSPAMILYKDVSGGTDNQIDTTEAFVLSIDGNDDFNLGDIRLTTVGACAAGTPWLGTDNTNCVVSTAGDYEDVTGASNAARLKYADSDGSTTFTGGEILVLEVGGGTSIATDDLCLSKVAAPCANAGVRATAAGGALTNLGADMIPDLFRIFDLDTSGGPTPGDLTFLDNNDYDGDASPGDGFSSPGDVRFTVFSSGSSHLFGDFPSIGEHDTVHVAIETPGTDAIGFYNVEGGLMSVDDPVLLQVGGTDASWDSNDLRLSAGATGQAAGTFISGGSESGKTVSSLTGSRFVTRTNDVYARLDADAVVEALDIRINPQASKPAGSKVTTATGSGEIGNAVTDISGFLIRYYDNNGDMEIGTGDTVIINRDEGSGTLEDDLGLGDMRLISPNDVRLSGALGTTSFTGTSAPTTTTTTTPTTTTPTTTTPTTTAAAAPALTNGMVAPPFAVGGSTFTFTVRYTHGGDVAPTVANLVIGGVAFPMTSSDTTYADGAVYSATATLAPGTYEFHFSFTAGSTVRHPTTGELFVYAGPLTDVPPTASGNTLSATTGDQDDVFTFSAKYTDSNNDAPTRAQVFINSHVTIVGNLTCADTTYYDGSVCSYSTKITEVGSHTYYFEFNDGHNTTRLPTTGTFAGPTITGNVTSSPTNGTSPTSTSSKPTPGLPVLVVVAAAAMAAAVLAVRRRRD